MQVEDELESLRTAYEELQISFKKRENLEYRTTTRMETEMKELRERDRNLEGENGLDFKQKDIVN